MSLEVTYRGNKGRFAALNGQELVQELRNRFDGQYVINSTIEDRGHTKAAQKVGGGNLTRVELKSRTGITLQTGETVYPIMRLRDQNYPGSALTVSFGLYRLVCANGLMAFRSVAEEVRIPHFKNRTETLMYLDRVIAASAEKVNAIIAHVNYLQALTVADPIKTIDSMGVPKTVKEQAKVNMATGKVRPEDNLNTVWGIYNFVNELDRTMARANSTAYLTRDENMLVSLAA